LCIVRYSARVSKWYDLLIMSPELIKAINERIVAGQTKEEIIKTVLAMGHTVEVAEAAYTLATHDQTVAKDAPLRFSARALFKRGWQFAKQHPRLTLVSALPLVLEVFLTATRDSELGSDGMYATVLIAASVLAALAYVFVLMVILMRLTKPDTPLTLSAALTFARQHFLSLCIIYLFSGLIILGGLSLLLLPGLAVMISITFAQYVYIHEGNRGLSALLHSAALVRGRFWHLLHKILAFIFLSFLPMLGLTIVFGIIDGMYESETIALIGEALLQVVAAVLTVINLHAMNSVYLALKQHDLNLRGKLFPKARYIILMIIGVTVIALIALAAAFAESIDFLDELPAIDTASGVQAQVSATSLIAKRYWLDNNQSYVGVCASLKNSVTESDDIQCNDSGEAWALTATDTDGARWCADKNTLAKKIQAPLDTRTECFAL
jgi:hypothetical protein